MEEKMLILVAVAFIPVFCIALAVVEVWLLAKSKLKLRETDSAKDRSISKANEMIHQWAEDNDFAFIGTFQIAHYHLAAWKYNHKVMFLCHHTHMDRGIELITVFKNDIFFCTANGSNWQGTPHFPGYYLQTFSSISMDDLWRRHAEMEEYLIKTGGAKLFESEMTFEDCLNYYRKKQTDHVRSFIGWPLRAFYWNIIRKFAWHNKTIKNQRERNMINLPNEVILQHLR
jgi:hypothetical protein